MSLADLPRKKLKEILGQHGQDLLNDSRRTRALLMDLCGENRLEVNLLISAQEEKIPHGLQSHTTKLPTAGLFNRLSKSLQEYRGMTPEAAAWAVESWAFALGVAVPKNWQHGKPKAPPKPAAPAAKPGAPEPPQPARTSPPLFGSLAHSQPFSTAPQTPPRPAPQPARPASPPPPAYGPRAAPQPPPRSNYSSSQWNSIPASSAANWQAPAPVPASTPTLPPNSPPGSNELVVSPYGSSAYSTISDALLKARPGMRIRILPGIYHENLKIETAVELYGDGPADQIIIEGDPALTVLSGQLWVRSLTLRSSGAFDPAVRLTDGPCLFEDCIFAATFQPGSVHPMVERRCRGLSARGFAVEAVLRNCRAEPQVDPQRSEPAAVIGLELDLSGSSRFAVEGGRFGEIRLTGESRCLLKGVEMLTLLVQGAGSEARVLDGRIGQAITAAGAAPSLENCRIQAENSPLRPTTGLQAQGKSSPRLTDCEISAPFWGMLACDGASPALKDCRLVVRTGSLQPQAPGSPLLPSATSGARLPAAARLQEGAQVSFQGCSFSGPGHGLELDSESKVEARQCILRANGGWGVWATNHSSGLISDCDLSGNTAGPYRLESSTTIRMVGNRT